MNKKVYDSIRSRLLAENRMLKFAILVIAASNVFFGYMAVKAVSHRHTVLVPFGISDTITVTDRVVSPKYLLFMGRQVFDLALSYTPANVKGQYEMLLSIVSPRTYQKYKALFANFVDQAQTGKLVSVFVPGSIKHDDKKHIILAKGRRLLLLEGSNAVEQEEVAYAVKYEIRLGQFFIEEIGKYENGKIVETSD